MFVLGETRLKHLTRKVSSIPYKINVCSKFGKVETFDKTGEFYTLPN